MYIGSVWWEGDEISAQCLRAIQYNSVHASGLPPFTATVYKYRGEGGGGGGGVGDKAQYNKKNSQTPVRRYHKIFPIKQYIDTPNCTRSIHYVYIQEYRRPTNVDL